MEKQPSLSLRYNLLTKLASRARLIVNWFVGVGQGAQKKAATLSSAFDLSHFKQTDCNILFVRWTDVPARLCTERTPKAASLTSCQARITVSPQPWENVRRLYILSATVLQHLAVLCRVLPSPQQSSRGSKKPVTQIQPPALIRYCFTVAVHAAWLLKVGQRCPEYQ